MSAWWKKKCPPIVSSRVQLFWSTKFHHNSINFNKNVGLDFLQIKILYLKWRKTLGSLNPIEVVPVLTSWSFDNLCVFESFSQVYEVSDG